MTLRFTVPYADSDRQFAVEEGSTTFFVGPNGSGKTRLATKIETDLGDSAHRVAAHRALSLLSDIPKISEMSALKQLRYGASDLEATVHWRSGNRYRNNGATALINDFDALLQALFADQANTSLRTHKQNRAGDLSRANPTKFEVLAAIWERLLPHRQLHITGDSVNTSIKGSSALYRGSDMSDGERAAFYLIGQVLVAAPNSLLLFDEPELHIHRSILSKLWDEVEFARSDCAFIVITHDLEFAASRVARKYLIRSYAPDAGWEIEDVPETGFDEETATLILGSRRPVLFVEGGTTSLDLAIYRACYPDWMVIPRGGCENVLHAVATMRANSALTRTTCAGIVDADDYSDEDIRALEYNQVAALRVAEIENLFLLPDVLDAIGLHEEMDGAERTRRKAALTEEIIETTNEKVISKAIARHLRRRIDRALKKLDFSSAEAVDDIAAEYSVLTGAIDIKGLAASYEARLRESLSNRDLTEIARHLDNKNMLTLVAKHFRNTGRGDFEAWATRIVGSSSNSGLRDALIAQLPEIQAL